MMSVALLQSPIVGLELPQAGQWQSINFSVTTLFDKSDPFPVHPGLGLALPGTRAWTCSGGVWQWQSVLP